MCKIISEVNLGRIRIHKPCEGPLKQKDLFSFKMNRFLGGFNMLGNFAQNSTVVKIYIFYWFQLWAWQNDSRPAKTCYAYMQTYMHKIQFTCVSNLDL